MNFTDYRRLSVFITACFACAAAQADVYECKEASGRVFYTEQGGKNCKISRLGSGFSTIAPVVDTENISNSAEAEQAEAYTANSRKAAGYANDIENARSQLNAARQALEAGKQVRYGNERNYSKYLERIQGLENAVTQSEQRLRELEQRY
ncbi:DUF4124 domain-containing protein [Stenoxybacter acetivorans]|uniref:DUF4124 domain-containing protein n=1 Tax=Stenoxybacter acetivorans TaxID=422441 RepID=UPI00056B4B09|nr:DUF4124 domain-containing protein [Stenoxybacter acetivorans]